VETIASEAIRDQQKRHFCLYNKPASTSLGVSSQMLSKARNWQGAFTADGSAVSDKIPDS